MQYQHTGFKYLIKTESNHLATIGLTNAVVVAMCVMSRPATGRGSLHHHRSQTDVTIDLQGVDELEVSETMLKGMCLHPIDHNPEGVILTTDDERERLSPVEGHPTTALLTAPMVPLLGVPDHSVLVETWIVMQSDARMMTKIHVEPGGIGMNSSLDGDGPARSKSTTDGACVWDSWHCRRKSRLRGESRLGGESRL